MLFGALGAGGVIKKQAFQGLLLLGQNIFHGFDPAGNLLVGAFEDLGEKSSGNPLALESRDFLVDREKQIRPPDGVIVPDNQVVQKLGLRSLDRF